MFIVFVKKAFEKKIIFVFIFAAGVSFFVGQYFGSIPARSQIAAALPDTSCDSESKDSKCVNKCVTTYVKDSGAIANSNVLNSGPIGRTLNRLYECMIQNGIATSRKEIEKIACFVDRIQVGKGTSKIPPACSTQAQQLRLAIQSEFDNAKKKDAKSSNARALDYLGPVTCISDSAKSSVMNILGLLGGDDRYSCTPKRSEGQANVPDVGKMAGSHGKGGEGLPELPKASGNVGGSGSANSLFGDSNQLENTERTNKVGTISSVDGSVAVRSADGTERILHNGDAVFQNDAIVSGSNGSATVTLMDNTTLNVGNRSEVMLDTYVYNPTSNNGSFNINTVKGAFRYVGGKLPGGPKFVITTPTASIGVRGTEFDIDVSAGKTDIVLYEGEIYVYNKSGEVTTLDSSGQAASVLSSGAISIFEPTVSFIKRIQTKLNLGPSPGPDLRNKEPQSDIIVYPEKAKDGEKVRITWASIFMESCTVAGPNDFSYEGKSGIRLAAPFPEGFSKKAAMYSLKCISQHGATTTKQAIVEFGNI